MASPRPKHELAQTLIEKAPAIVLLLSPEGRIQHANPCFESLTGYRLEEIAGKDWFDSFLPEGDRARIRALFRNALGGSPTGTNVNPILTRNGEQREIEWSDSLIRDESGRVTSLLAIGTDVTDQIRTERKLRASEEVLREVVTLSGIGIFDHDHRSDHIYWSPEQRRNYGWNADEPVTLSKFLECVYPDDTERVFAAVRRAHDPAGDGRFDIEHRIIRRDGAVRWLSTRSQTFFEGEGAVARPIRTIGAVIDVTERVTAEQTLHASRAQLIQAQQMARIGSWELDLVGGRLDWSDEIFHIFEIDKERFGASYDAFLAKIHPEDRAAVDKAYSGSLTNRTPYRIIHRLLMDDGRIKWVEEHCQTSYDAAGKPLRSSGTVQDVTERVEAERAVRESEKRLAEAERIAHVGHWMAEIASGKLICSEGLYRIFGLEPRDREPSAAWFYDMVHPEDQALVRKAEAAALARIAPYHVEFRIVRADGAIRHLESRAETECDATGNPTRLFGVTQDITELRQTEAQLREAQKLEAIGRLTGGVAHDFNNLLGIIIGNLDLLAAELEPGTKRRNLIDRALKAAELGGSLTQHLLAFSQQQALQPQAVRPDALVQQAIPLLQRAVGDAIGLRMKVVHQPWICSVDPAQLQTALINLAVNARDAMPESGEITIEVGTCNFGQAAEQIGTLSAGEYVTVSLSDTGTGMPPAVMARAFDPFFTTKEIGKGTGLGLSMVQGFCRQSGGDATIESEVGRGTTVRLYLPRSRDAWEKPAPPMAEPSLPDQGETLLVVEDNPDLREYMFEALQSLGYRLVVAESGQEALTRLAEVPQIAAVVCDVVLPGPMSGFEFAREAHRRRRDLQFLFVSGHTDAANAGDILRELEADFLPKPFRRNELGRFVQSALIRSRARVAREA